MRSKSTTKVILFRFSPHVRLGLILLEKLPHKLGLPAMFAHAPFVCHLLMLSSTQRLGARYHITIPTMPSYMLSLKNLPDTSREQTSPI